MLSPQDLARHGLQQAMADVAVFSSLAVGPGGPGSGRLRPYQAEVCRAGFYHTFPTQ